MAYPSLAAIWRGVLACSCAAAGVMGCASTELISPDQRAQDPPFDFYTEHLESRGDLARLGSVRIVNHWGDIRVRRSSSGAITVDAAIQRIGEPFPEPPTFDVIEGRGSFALEVQYPGASLNPRTGRVDIVTYIPADLVVSLDTVDGTIELKGTHLELTATTESGDVLFVNEGSAKVRSVSGEIHAAPLRSGWGELDLHSESGKVRANLPLGTGLEVRASGTDQIESDWPIVQDGTSQLIRLGDQGKERDRVLITSGNAIAIRKVLSRPDPGTNQ